MNPNPKVYFPNLDGLRFFCFLSVFLYHSFATKIEHILADPLYIFVRKHLVNNGNLGVNFFFVLSGFLITYLLLVEKNRFSHINIRNFYIRRLLRIWPLFYFCVFFGFVIFPFIKLIFGEVPYETATPVYYLLFINNIDLIQKGLPDSSTLSILWSVAIEEQFYFIWPLIISIVPLRFIHYIFFIIIASTFVFRLIYYESQLMLEHHTFSCISDMAIGGLFAYLVFNKKRFVEKIESAPKFTWLMLYAMVAIVFLFRKEIFWLHQVLLASDRLIISILFALVIVEQNYAHNSIFKMSNFKYVSKLGTYTYGLYCLHMIGILSAAKLLAYLDLNVNVYQVIFLEGSLSLSFTLFFAYFSYHLYEKRFLKLKNKFAIVKTENAQNTTTF